MKEKAIKSFTFNFQVFDADSRQNGEFRLHLLNSAPQFVLDPQTGVLTINSSYSAEAKRNFVGEHTIEIEVCWKA